MNEDIKVTFDSVEEDVKTSLDVGSIQYGQLEIGTTKTGAAGTEATVTNSGSSSHAILNFTIPRGSKGEKGDKGDTGAAGKDGKDGKDGEITGDTLPIGAIVEFNGTEIPEGYEEYDGGSIGDLNDLNTTDKSSIVGAINESLGKIPKFKKLNSSHITTKEKITLLDNVNNYQIICIETVSNMYNHYPAITTIFDYKTNWQQHFLNYSTYGSEAKDTHLFIYDNILDTTNLANIGTNDNTKYKIIAVYGIRFP